MFGVDEVLGNIQKTIQLIEIYQANSNIPELGAMSRSQLSEFKQVFLKFEYNLSNPKTYKKNLLTDNYISWISHVIADSWPVSELGEQIMKTEQSFVRLREKIQEEDR